MAEQVIEAVEEVAEDSSTVSMETIMGNLGEEYTDNATLSKFSTGEDLAKSYIDLQKLVGSKVEKIPDAASTEEEISNFYGKLTPEDGYGIDLPEGLKGLDGSDARLEGALELAKEAGLSTYQADKLFKGLLASEETEYQDMLAQNEQALEQGMTDLKAQFGEGTDAMLGQVKELQEKLGCFEDFEANGLNNNPALIKVFAKLAVDLGEKSTMDKITSTTPQGLEEELTELNSRARTLMKNEEEIPAHLQQRINEIVAKM